MAMATPRRAVRKKVEETVPEVLDHLGEQLLTIETAKIEINRLARHARAMGATWQQIGAKVGISAQEARQRFS